jgi:hypothetical protein
MEKIKKADVALPGLGREKPFSWLDLRCKDTSNF